MMKRTLLLVLLCSFFASVAFADFTFDKPNSLNSWDKVGNVKWRYENGPHGGYAKLGKYASSMWKEKHLQAGTYEVCFDYRTRSGCIPSVNVFFELPRCKVDFKDTTAVRLKKSRQWMSAKKTVTLKGGKYLIGFAHLGSGSLHLDNICADRIPAPSAVVLSAVGMGLVGWLRRKKAI